MGVVGNFEPMPDKFKVTVQYKDAQARKYVEHFKLDLDLSLLDTYSEPESRNNPEERQNNALEAIAWSLWEK